VESAPPIAAGRARYFDSRLGAWIVKVPPGDHYVTTDAEERVATTLGSCVAACVRDPTAGAGGLNHFLLPGDPHEADGGGANAGMRYGQNAMERLINDVLSHGGRKDRLEVKIFGGGRLMGWDSDIGGQNVAFVREYLAAEGLPVAAEDVGGPYPRRIVYEPASGRVDRLLMRRAADRSVQQDEAAHRRALRAIGAAPGDVELFD